MPRKAKLSVAVISVPITKRENSRFEHFQKGLLDEQRKAIVSHINGNKQRFGADVEVKDCGDLIDAGLTRPGSSKFIDEATVAKLGKKIEALRKKHDLVIMIGERHTGAAFAYTGHGEVAHFDAHTDRGGYPLPAGAFPGISRPDVNASNYVGRSIAAGFKKEDQIRHYELPSDLAWKEDAEIFDIDLDVFKRHYNMEKMYSMGMLNIPDVGKPVADSKRINLLNISEYRKEWDDNGTAMRLMKGFALAAIGAVERRKRGK